MAKPSSMVTTPLPEGSGFLEQLCRNRPAYVPKAVSRPVTECPLVHDDRGRNIPGESRAAIAAMLPFGERLDPDRPAVGASLGSPARIDEDDRPTSLCSFIGQHRRQLAPCGIVDRLGQHRADKAPHVEIFQGDMRVRAHQAVRELVQEVAATRSSPRLMPGHSATGTLPPGGEPTSACEHPLASAQAFRRPPGPLGRSDGLACRHGNEARKAHVDPDGTDRALEGGHVDLDLEADEPLAVRA